MPALDRMALARASETTPVAVPSPEVGVTSNMSFFDSNLGWLISHQSTSSFIRSKVRFKRR